MKKQLRNIIIALCVVVVLVVGVVVANIVIKKSSGTQSSSQSSSSSSDIQVLKLNATDVEELSIKNKTEEYSIKQSNKKYSIDGIDTSLLSQDTLGSPVNTAAQLTASKKIEDNATDLKQYGLDNPTRVVTVKTKAKTVKINVGSETPLKDGYYVCLDSAKTVYKVETSKVTDFDKGKMDFVNLSLYSIDSSKTSGLTQLAFDGAARTTPLVLDKEKATGASSQSDSTTFVLSTPANYEVDASKTSSMVTTLSSFTASGVISLDCSAANLEKYGLATPQYQVTVTNDGKKSTFDFGKPYTEDGKKLIPVMLKGRNAIYKLDDTDDAFYKYELKDICQSLLFTDYIDTVKNVKVNVDGKDYTLALDGTGDALTATLNGKKISTNNARKLYGYVVGIGFDGQNTKTVTGNPTTTISIKYRAANSKDAVMKFVPMDARKSYWIYNDRSDFYVLNSCLEKLSTGFKDAAEGKELTD